MACQPAARDVVGVVEPRQQAVSLFERPWVWKDEQGQPVELSQWRGTTLVVTAVYTSCTRTCPVTVEKLKAIFDAYGRAGRSAQFVLVTVDPNNDTPERLRQWQVSRKLPLPWHLLAGDARTTEAFMDLLDIHVLAEDPHIVHDTRIMVFDGRGIAQRSFACCDFDEQAAVY